MSIFPKFPYIVIKYSRLLDPVFIFYCQNNPELKKRGWNDWVPPSQDVIMERIKNYKSEWGKYESKVLSAITDCTGLDFKVNLLKVYIVSGNPRSFSDPIIIKSGYSPGKFVDNLAHELIHQIFDLNQTTMEIYEEEYTKEEIVTVKRHVIVYAILKYIYLDILNEKYRLERDIENTKINPASGHLRAWEIVEKNDYKKIISNLKKKTGQDA